MTSPSGWALGDARLDALAGALDNYTARHSEEVQAMRGVKLCRWCQDLHFKSYPEQAGSACNQVQCQCWCTQGTGQ